MFILVVEMGNLSCQYYGPFRTRELAEQHKTVVLRSVDHVVNCHVARLITPPFK